MNPNNIRHPERSEGPFPNRIDPDGMGGGAALSRRKPLIPSAIFAMLMFVATEVMFFVALISAYLVIKAGAAGGWAPPEGVRLPILATAFNTLVLLASGVSLHVAGRHFARPGGMEKARIWYLRATVLGAFFVIFQGYEWVQLIRHGMTMLSDIFGATFFLLIGTHGLHALFTILAMGILFPKLSSLKLEHMRALQVFWYFIVGVWPLLYGLVYF